MEGRRVGKLFARRGIKCETEWGEPSWKKRDETGRNAKETQDGQGMVHRDGCVRAREWLALRSVEKCSCNGENVSPSPPLIYASPLWFFTIFLFSFLFETGSLFRFLLLEDVHGWSFWKKSLEIIIKLLPPSANYFTPGCFRSGKVTWIKVTRRRGPESSSFPLAEGNFCPFLASLLPLFVPAALQRGVSSNWEV